MKLQVYLTETEFIENIVPSILRQTHYEVQTETQIYTTFFTQFNTVYSTATEFVPRYVTHNQVRLLNFY